MKQCIFWYYLGFQVMAFLCWAAKNSLRGTMVILTLSFHRQLLSYLLEAIAWERFHFPMGRFYVIMELGRDQLSSSVISSLISCH
jgi:hypothetical protein